MSPWIDLSCRNESWKANAAFDWLPSRASDIHSSFTTRIKSPVRMYVIGEKDRSFKIPLRAAHSHQSLKLAGLLESSDLVDGARVSSCRKVLDYFVGHPLVSPINANLAGLPPLLCVRDCSRQITI
jgi:hypothetical protein